MAKGDLAFVKLKSDVVEGDLMVGLGSVMSVEEGGKLMIHWFGRSQWLCSRSQQRWSWAATPFFKPLPHTQDTTEQLTDILPIIPTLTPSATLSKPRLTADCVRTIHALCVFRSLVHADDTRDAQGFGAESEGSEQESEQGSEQGSEQEEPSEDKSDSSEQEADSPEPEADTSEPEAPAQKKACRRSRRRRGQA